MSGWTLFTLRGVAVKLHMSLIFLVLFVVLVGMAQFPVIVQLSGANAFEMSGSPLLWSFLFSVALVASIFVHEFGHVLVAQAHGHEVKQVTLMMLGGVSHIENLPDKASEELKIAIIGPIVSLAIGGILLALRTSTESANLDFFFYWVGQTNIILGIFNLLPAFPLDGGRVVRALLVLRQGKLKGTENAVRISRVFAWIFGILGILQFNLILILIALFVYAAAKSELVILTGQAVLKDLRAKDFLLSTPYLREDTPVAVAAEQMLSSRNLFLPVQGENQTYSIVTSESLKRIPKDLWETVPVKRVQSSVSKAIHPEDLLDEVLPILLSVRGGGLPIVENNQILGVLPLADLLEAIELRKLAQEKFPRHAWPLAPRHSH